MNIIVLQGRLTRDCELKYTPSGTAVATASIAVDRKFSKEKEADFINLVAWGKTGEFMAERVAKGNRISVTGRLQIRSYDAKDGSKRTVAEVVVDQVYPIDWANKAPAGMKEFSDLTPVDDANLPF